MRKRNIVALMVISAALLGAGTALYYWYGQSNEQSAVVSQSQRSEKERSSAAKSSSQSAIMDTSSSAQAASSGSSSSSSSAAASSASSAASSSTPAIPELATGGMNHNAAANAYAYDSAAVQTKMTQLAAPGEQRVVFLTFDDGVNTTMTPRVLATLKQYGVHATFFIVGNTITSQTAPILRQEFAEGHAIGTHSFDHVYTTLYPGRQGSTAAIVKEAADGIRALQGVLGTGYYPKMWRYPGGHMSWRNLAGADAALRQMNLTWMDWNAAVGDALGAAQSPHTVAAMLAYHTASLRAYPQSAYRVVLMHDAPDKAVTLAALPSIIQYYRDNGYQFGVLG